MRERGTCRRRPPLRRLERSRSGLVWAKSPGDIVSLTVKPHSCEHRNTFWKVSVQLARRTKCGCVLGHSGSGVRFVGGLSEAKARVLGKYPWSVRTNPEHRKGEGTDKKKVSNCSGDFST
eukprot:1925306-Rhodomonas_salina.1